MRILFIVPYSSEAASNRYRVEQYLPYLKKEGIDYDIRPFVFKEFYEIIYLKRGFFKKIIYFLRSLFNRAIDILRLYRYDLVFIHREACPFGPPVFEWLVYKFNKPIIFDFDDAIFLQNFNPINSIYRFLKFPYKTSMIIKMSSSVIVANKLLEGYSTRLNKNVNIIATPIDTEKFYISDKKNKRFTIGWIGSPTTAVYLKIVFNAMQSLSKKYDFILKIVGADKDICIPGVKIENCNWSLDKEVKDFQSLDIGIYPMPDTLWARGKAGFKAIQYMAVGVPVVASSVGIINEIIQDGVNGFLADNDMRWIESIAHLIEDRSLREKISLAGRKTAEERFSVKANVDRFIEVLKREGELQRR
ncbi:glycosyltransferase family 4 protein [Candidatus Omnitrophota bacterium]